MNVIPGAMADLTKLMQEDEGYAWGWHCNLAMSMQDRGIDHKTANLISKDIMQLFFKVDMSKLSDLHLPKGRCFVKPCKIENLANYPGRNTRPLWATSLLNVGLSPLLLCPKRTLSKKEAYSMSEFASNWDIPCWVERCI